MNNMSKGGIMFNNIIKKIKRWVLIKKQIKRLKKELKKPKTFIY